MWGNGRAWVCILEEREGKELCVGEWQKHLSGFRKFLFCVYVFIFGFRKVFFFVFMVFSFINIVLTWKIVRISDIYIKENGQITLLFSSVFFFFFLVCVCVSFGP